MGDTWLSRLSLRRSLVVAALCAVATSQCSRLHYDPAPLEAGLDPGLVSSFEHAGFTLQGGRLGLVDFSQCCGWPTCFGNNPTSPYLAISMLRGVNQTARNSVERPDGTSVAWRIGADEAVVLVGRTPPRAAYFGYTLDVFDRHRPGLLRRPTLASLGDTLNNLTIATDGTRESPFDRRTALIITANRTTAQRVRTALVAWGFPDRAINVMPIPTELARVGLDRRSDTFQLLQRVALSEDRAAADAYLAAPRAMVFRASPRQPIAASAFATPALRRHGTGTTEAGLRGSLDALHDAILERHGRTGAEEVQVAHRPPFRIDQFGYYCIRNGLNCLADNHDTLYPTSLPFFLRQDDRVVVWGVNHEATGKATYSSFTVYGIRHLVGVVSVTSRELAGSAADYLPGDPNVGRLYAWSIARECGNEPHCTEIPTGCPGVDLSRPGFVAFRMYMEPSTATSPHPAELLLDGVTRFPH